MNPPSLSLSEEARAHCFSSRDVVARIYSTSCTPFPGFLTRQSSAASRQKVVPGRDPTLGKNVNYIAQSQTESVKRQSIEKERWEGVGNVRRRLGDSALGTKTLERGGWEELYISRLSLTVVTLEEGRLTNAALDCL